MKLAVTVETHRPTIAQGMGPALAVAQIILHGGLFGAVIGGLGCCLDVHGMPTLQNGWRVDENCPPDRAVQPSRSRFL